MYRRIVAFAALAAMLLPVTGAHAGTDTYQAPWSVGPKAGDSFTMSSADAATGRASLWRLQPPLVSGGLGCTGRGGFVTLEKRGITSPISSVDLALDEAVWDPFTWVTLSVLSTDGAGASYYLGTTKVRGPAAGSSVVELDIPLAERVPAGRAQTVRFGLEVSSSCVPNVDGGMALFRSITVETD